MLNDNIEKDRPMHIMVAAVCLINKMVFCACKKVEK